MSNTNELEAITRQLAPFYEAWETFYPTSAKVARWLVPVEHYRWVEAFIEIEATEAGELPDIFLRFEAPFEDISSYGIALRNEFRKMVADDRAPLQEEDIELKWAPVSPTNAHHSSQYFFEELREFTLLNEFLEESFILYLAPVSISDSQGWSTWLAGAVEYGVPNPLRLTVIDTLEAPVFHTITEEIPNQIITLTPDFDLDQAIQEMASAGDPSDPGVAFRSTFVALTKAARNNDWPLIHKLSREALEIAHEHKWIHLEATVHMVVAGAYLNDQRYEESFKQYEYAYHTSKQRYHGIEELEGPIHQSCEQVAIQALFGEANTLIAQSMYLEPADIYKTAAEMASQGGYTHYELEAWRMAGYCYEQGRQYDIAWEANERALKVGSELDEETRRGSTLPYVGQAMLRLTQKAGKSQETYYIKDKMIEMVGMDWESKIESK